MFLGDSSRFCKDAAVVVGGRDGSTIPPLFFATLESGDSTLDGSLERQ
jgi:hypothetical protein